MSVTFGHAAPSRTLAPEFGALLISSNYDINNGASKGAKEFEWSELSKALANVPGSDQFIAEVNPDHRDPEKATFHIYAMPVKVLTEKGIKGDEVDTVSSLETEIQENWQGRVTAPIAKLLTNPVKEALINKLKAMVTLQYSDVLHNKNIELT